MTTPNWIKMRTDLRDHPKVVRMASICKTDSLRIVGACWCVWSTFDTHSIDGTLEGYTLATIDEKAFRGFGAAMVAVHWLEECDDGLSIPEFSTHNGSSAKRRALDTKRTREARDEDKGARGTWIPDGHLSAPEADKKTTRVRVERERKTPVVPSPGFVEFWDVWPKSTRKGEKSNCAKLWEERGLEREAAEIIAHVKAMAASESWTKQAGEFIPAPLVYLRNGRWDGAEIGDAKSGAGAFEGAV